MATLAGTLTTPDPDAVIEGTIDIVAPDQRDVGGVTLVRIAHKIPVADSAYSKAGVPAGEYDVLERLEDGDGTYGTEQVYRILVPEGEGTYSIRGLREIYAGAPPTPSELEALLAFIKADSDATYVRSVNGVPVDPDGNVEVGSGSVPTVWPVDPAVAGSGFTPSQRTAYFHALIADIVAAGGSNIIDFPALNFVVAIENDTPSMSGSTVLFVLPSGTTLNFRPGTTVTISDASASGAANSVLMWQFGTGDAAASGFAVRDATFANKANANSKSFWGAGNRRSVAAAKTDDVTYERCRFNDVTVGATNARRNPTASLGSNRDQNWRVLGCDFRTSNNRAIELAQVKGGLIQGNTFDNVQSAIHLLLYTEGIQARDNRAVVTDSGIRINVGVKNCQFDGGRYEYAAGATSSYGALHFHTEPDVTSYETADIDFANHYFGVPSAGGTRKSLSFMSTVECTAAKVNRIKFTNCTFAGNVDLTPFNTSAGHEMEGWTFTNCDFYGNFVNVISSTHNIHDFRFINCRFHAMTGETINANRMFFENCEFDATPTLAATAFQSQMINPISPVEPVNLTGDANAVKGWIARPGPQLNPAAVLGSTVWDADDLTAGTFTSWAPHAGSAETAAFTPLAAAPTVVASAMGSHKAVRFVAASVHRLVGADLSSAKAQPYSRCYIWKTTANATDQYLVAGKTNNQPVTRHLAAGQVAHRASATGAAVQPGTVRAADVWHCTIEVFDGANSKVFTDSVIRSTGTLTEVEPLAAYRIGSSGSGSATAPLNGDFGYLAHMPGALSDGDAAKIMRWLGVRAGITIA
jgi:hypothetical protein